MSEWWTYRLSDFLMFTPETYYRLFELHNIAVWPVQVLTVALSLAAVRLPWRGPGQNRAVMLFLAAMWLWVGWAFQLHRYATINLAASWFAVAFALQGLLLFGVALLRRDGADRKREKADRMGLAVMAFAVVVQPLLAPLLGRSWRSVELAGVAPDPTALLTLGFLSAVRAPWPLWPIPILWSLVTGATLWAMRAGDAWVLPGMALLVVGRVGWERARRRRGLGGEKGAVRSEK
jgi:Family of unknown function (DUF6064)